jgi:hypothetical protein
MLRIVLDIAHLKPIYKWLFNPLSITFLLFSIFKFVTLYDEHSFAVTGAIMHSCTLACAHSQAVLGCHWLRVVVPKP